MKILKLTQSVLIGLTFVIPTMVKGQDFERSIITDPSISRRCESMLERRREKIQNKQRLDSLVVRNQGLQRSAPDNKLTAKKKLERHLNKVQRERRLTLMQIQEIEEEIVRQGCPGIQL